MRITNSFIKWGKDPEKIETDCQIYPLKDIKSIIYGRVSPNLNENCNKMLSYSKCFSLQLQKRTLDFYCKNYEEIEGWVCGLSAALKKQQVRVVGYTPGKLRWKKMFAILKEGFIEPLKVSERGKYYYENAYSLILFAKNGYKLRGQENK